MNGICLECAIDAEPNLDRRGGGCALERLLCWGDGISKKRSGHSSAFKASGGYDTAGHGGGRTSTKSSPLTPPEKSVGRAASEREPVKWTDVAQAVSALAVMLFTALLAWLSWRQHNLEQRLARDTADSIAIARQSADAAASLALTTKEAAEKQLRAYVRPELVSFNILGPVSEGSQTGVVVQFVAELRNSGNTPAWKLVSGARVVIVPWPDTGEVSQPENLTSFVEVPSQGVNPATFTQRLLFDRARLIARTSRPYVRIRLEYEDVFGGSWESDFHWTIINFADLLDAMDRGHQGTMPSQAEMLTDRCTVS